VRDGKIPFLRLPGKRRKVYLYDEVKEAIIEARDPSRDAQRKANERRRKESGEPSIEDILFQTLERIRGKSTEIRPEMFELSELEELGEEEFSLELAKINHANLTLRDLSEELSRTMADVPAHATMVLRTIEGYTMSIEDVGNFYNVQTLEEAG
jgi:hypothetical protein